MTRDPLPAPTLPVPGQYHRILPEVEARIDLLIGQMTLDEKVGQLNQVSPTDMPDPDEFVRLMNEVGMHGGRPSLPPRPGLEDDVRAGRIGSLLNLCDPVQANRLQRLAREESRLGIPLLMGADIIHGFRTIFPIPLAESCSWNPALLEQAARVAANEASATGVNWIFAPMVDVGWDARWGRVAEGAGEDPYLTGVLAAARVRGFQATDLESGLRVAACPKHYVGYGAVEAGRGYSAVDVSERTLREVHLPPFRVAFEAGAGTVMSAFNETGGLPATANDFILKTVLRDEWQWPGVVLSDYEAVRELIPHGVARDLRDAARQSIGVGLDVDMMSGAYDMHLAALIGAGAVEEAWGDEAVRRVLRLKVQLGLFEQPYVDETLAGRVMLQEEARRLALEVARQSMVLLKNDDDVLPLDRQAHIALIGPLADAARDQLGCWVLEGCFEDAETVLQAMQASGATVTHVSGCALQGNEGLDLDAAVQAAQDADVVVLVLGEGADLSGEARSRAYLGLPGCQERLADAVLATGTPVVTVLMSGRPLVIPDLAGRTTALLAAWHGGIRAGQAVTDLLFGTVNPSGRLTAGWPRTEGQLPLSYTEKNTGRPMQGDGTVQFGEPYKSRYIDVPNSPLFPFGFGLSYTRFAYETLNIVTPTVEATSELVVELNLRNIGTRDGIEVVQLYVRDLVGSVTRPVRELKGFARVTVNAGEAQVVQLRVPVDRLALYRRDGQFVPEAGEFEVWVGPNAQEGLCGTFWLKDAVE